MVAIDGPLPNGPAGDPTDSDVTLFRYDDPSGHLLSVVSPGSAIRRFASRDPGGRATTTIDSDGYREVERQTGYDLRGNVVSSTVRGG